MADAEVTDEIRYALDGGIARITIDRPGARNAIAPVHRNRIIELLEQSSADLHVRVVVLTGTSGAFCTGADLRAKHASAPRPDDAPERSVGEISQMIRDGAQRLVASVLDCDKPVIAAVNGVAAGIGAHLALACDLVVAAESARFIEVFSRRGLVPDGGGAWLLPRLIGTQRAKELLFFADDVSAERAEQLGLANRVVADDDLDAAVTEWAERLATAPTRSLALTKRLVNRAFETDRASAFAEEAVAQELNMGTHDAQEGVQSFVERRDPTYRGW